MFMYSARNTIYFQENEYDIMYRYIHTYIIP